MTTTTAASGNITTGDRSAEQAAHTPGPWHFEELSNRYHPEEELDGCGYIRCETDNLEISHHGDMGRTRAENLANARVIAAAPDMLAALQAVDELWSRDALDFDAEMNADSPVGKVWAPVRAAIAKATGTAD